MPLLLLFRRGYGDWPERPVAAPATPVTPAADRFLVAPLETVPPRPLKRPVKRTKLR